MQKLLLRLSGSRSLVVWITEATTTSRWHRQHVQRCVSIPLVSWHLLAGACANALLSALTLSDNKIIYCRRLEFSIWCTDVHASAVLLACIRTVWAFSFAVSQHLRFLQLHAHRLLCWCLGGGWQGEPASATPDCDAVLLDLGELYVPGLAAVLPAISSGSRAASSDGGWQRWLQQQQQGSVLPQHVGTSCVGLQAILGAITSWGADAGCSPTSQPPSAALAAVAAALFTPPCSARSSSEPSIGPVMLQLYSIAPRALSGRAVSWGCIVAAGPGAQRTSGGFWDAPGAGMAQEVRPAS